MSRSITLSTDLVTVYVDGEAVQVPANANLIQACERVRKYIPHYCWHPSLSIPGNCRLCLLKVEGGPPKLVAGCHTVVRPDMKIWTNTAEVADSREGMMEFLLANHPLDCPVCDRGGECSLQRFSMDYGAGDTRFQGNAKRRMPKPDMDPLISIERNRCIHCTRCIRFCDEVAGEAVMGMFGRGDQCYISTFGDGPVSNIYSGNVIDLCPVGCLTNKPYRFKARPWELRQVPSVCTLCASGCRVTHWMRAGLVYRTTPPTKKSDQFGKQMLDYDTTDFLCNQGRFGNDFARHADRETRVLIARSGEQAEASFEDAVAQTASKLGAAAAAGRVAVLVSPRLTTEELFAAQFVARRALKTNSIDWRARLPHAEAAAALSEGMAIADGSIDRIEQNDVVLLVGGAAAQTLPISALDVREAARRGQIRLYVAGARNDRYLADQARASFAVEPAQVEAFLAAAGGEGAFPFDDASGANAGAAAAMRDDIAGAAKVLVLYEPGQLSGHAAVAQVRAIRALKQRLGDKLATLPLVAEANARGAFFAGAQPDRLPAAPLGAAASRERFTAEFGGEPPAAAGLTGPEILRKAAAGELDALLILGAGDLLEHHPDPALVEAALTKVPFLAVCDLFADQAGAAADVFFPAAAFNEKSGTLLNVEGRVGLVGRAEPPQGAARTELALLAALATALGAPLPAEGAETTFHLLQKIAQSEGVAVVEEAAPSFEAAPRVAQNQSLHLFFRGAAKTPKATSYFQRPEALNGFAAKCPAPASPGKGLRLVWDDVLQGRSAHGDRAAQRDILQDKPTVELHPTTAAAQGLHDRDRATLSFGDASLGDATFAVEVRTREGVAPGVVYTARNVLLLPIPCDLGSLPVVELRPSENA